MESLLLYWLGQSFTTGVLQDTGVPWENPKCATTNWCSMREPQVFWDKPARHEQKTSVTQDTVVPREDPRCAATHWRVMWGPKVWCVILASHEKTQRVPRHTEAQWEDPGVPRKFSLSCILILWINRSKFTFQHFILYNLLCNDDFSVIKLNF